MDLRNIIIPLIMPNKIRILPKDVKSGLEVKKDVVFRVGVGNTIPVSFLTAVYASAIKPFLSFIRNTTKAKRVSSEYV